MVWCGACACVKAAVVQAMAALECALERGVADTEERSKMKTKEDEGMRGGGGGGGF